MKKRATKFVSLLSAFLLTGLSATPVFAEEAEVLTGKTAMEITKMMGKGWNLGNTFDATGGNRNDAYSQETSWGNPRVTKELIDGVKAAGFSTIRIPITWHNYIDTENNYQIEEAFLNRINEIVDYAFENELFVIMNVHHEAWVNDPEIHKNYEQIGEELNAVWAQIADRFAEYDQHLIFEGMNEPRAAGLSYEWTGTQECYDAVNYLDQIFVECIRSNGKGYNSERALMIPGYAASSNPVVLKSIQIPQIDDMDAENIIISTHCYSPYNFCLSDNQDSFSPGNSADTADITNLIRSLETLFLSKDIPVIIGECGATNTRDNHEARKLWMTYFSDITRENGIPAILWDNGAKGNSGGECHNYFERKTGEMAYPELLHAFIYGDAEANAPKDLFIDFEPYQEGGTTNLAAPAQYGFTPGNLTKKAKVNHTPDAVVGFSTVLAKSGKSSSAAMDLSKYAGETVNISLFLSSEKPGTVTLSLKESESQEIVSVETDTEWTKVSFSCQLSDTSDCNELYFRGEGTFDYYLDDISLAIAGEDAPYELQIQKDSSR